MVLDATVKLGTEVRVFISSGAQSLVSIDLQDIATETSNPFWQEVGFYRTPIDQSEPDEIVDIYKGRLIDHTKLGREQRKTLTLVSAWTNTGNALRKFRGKSCLIKLEWHVDSLDPRDEREYYTNARMTAYTRGIPDGEVNERADFVFAKYGHKDG